MQITAEWLDQNRACHGQVDIFKATFPEGADVTQDNLITAARAGLDIEWFAGAGTLNFEQLDDFDAVLEDAADSYRARLNPLRIQLNADTDKASCLPDTIRLREQYDIAKQPIDIEYQVKLAEGFWRIYANHN